MNRLIEQSALGLEQKAERCVRQTAYEYETVSKARGKCEQFKRNQWGIMLSERDSLQKKRLCSEKVDSQGFSGQNSRTTLATPNPIHANSTNLSEFHPTVKSYPIPTSFLQTWLIFEVPWKTLQMWMCLVSLHK